MQIRENISLQPFNTFGIEATAKYFAAFRDVGELQVLLYDHRAAGEKLVLGGGSNLLLTRNFDGFVLRNEIEGIEVVKEDTDSIYVKAGAGVNWHRLVMYCVERGYAGMENLALIPGNVGASPMQNIGAYGVEIKDVFHRLEAWHIEEEKQVSFDLPACEFGYRESVFKRRYKGQFVILSVTYRLRKQPVFHTDYGAIRQELERMGVSALSIKAVADAVIAIRSSKLPDPKEVGNAGSFFKNPVVDPVIFEGLKKAYPAAPSFVQDDGKLKIPAGWLIEQCGWKGHREGDAGCYPKQALVLVNYGSATGQEIYRLSEKIVQSVKDKFGITLEREVNIL